jgi:hypothetical protein
MLACSRGLSYTPAQLQRAIFCASSHAPVLDGVAQFKFETCDFGLYDPDVLVEVHALEAAGDAVITPGGIGRWPAYAASDAGMLRGCRILDGVDAPLQQCLRQISTEVRKQPQGRYAFRRICCCAEC